MGLVYLDPDDELITAASRIRAAAEPRVGLVLPGGSRIGTSRINFRLLAGEAERANRELSIVSPDPATRALAAAAGLAAYPSVAAWEAGAAEPLTDDSIGPAGDPGSPPPAARSAASPIRDRSSGPSRPRDRGPRSRIPALLAILVAAVVVAVAGGAFAVNTIPTATVTVEISPEPLGPLTFTVKADPSASGPIPAKRVVPLERQSLALSVSGSYEATGKKVTETRAKGSVTWQNCDPTRSYTIAAGTTVRTAGGVAFRTGEAIFLPVATLTGNPPKITCQTRDVAVTATAAGTAGNVRAGTITKVPSTYNPVVLRVTNAAATSGGSRTETKVVSQADVDAAVEALSRALDEKLAEEADAAASSTPEGIDVLVATATRTDATYLPAPASLVGGTGATFALTASAEGRVSAVDRAGIVTVAEGRLQAAVPPDAELVDGSVAVTIADPAVSGTTVTYAVRASASIVRTVDVEAVRAAVLGKSLAAAREAASSFGTVGIVISPDWTGTIPADPSRVRVELRRTDDSGGTPAPAASPSGSG